MATPIRYCDQCKGRLSPEEQSEDDAIVTDSGTICAACASRMAPEVRDLIRNSPGRGAAEPASRAAPDAKRVRSSLIRSRAKRAPARHLGVVAVSAVGGLVLVVLVYVLAVSSARPPEGDSQPAAQSPPSSSPVVPPKGPLPPTQIDECAEQLALIKQRIDPGLMHYGQVRTGLVDLIARYPQSPAVGEVRVTLADLDSSYAAAAEKALAEALRASDECRGRNEFDAGRSILRSIASRFAEGDWLRTKGRTRIDEALARLEAARPAPPQDMPPPPLAAGWTSIFDGRARPEWKMHGAAGYDGNEMRLADGCDAVFRAQWVAYELEFDARWTKPVGAGGILCVGLGQHGSGRGANRSMVVLTGDGDFTVYGLVDNATRRLGHTGSAEPGLDRSVHVRLVLERGRVLAFRDGREVGRYELDGPSTRRGGVLIGASGVDPLWVRNVRVLVRE